jgi:hypothetical protein
MIFENLGSERARLLLGSGNEPAGSGERKRKEKGAAAAAA